MKHKNLYYKGDAEWLKSLKEEYEMSGHTAEIIDGELVVYAGTPPKKEKRKAKFISKAEQAERWSKRERNFGYTRPN